jgi:hypothetical protein
MGGSAGGGAGGEAGAGGATPACVPTETKEVTCNNIDDDCNGHIDDVDIGQDGFCDCLRIGILGSSGSNPSANFQKWLTDRGTTVDRIQQDGSGTLDLPVLTNYDVMVLDRLGRDYTSAEAATFVSWVNSGGGFLSMTGYTNDASIDFRANSLLGNFGFAYDGSILSGPITQFQPHPVTAGLTSVTFLGGYHITSTPTVGVSTLLGTIGTTPVAYAHERGDGRGVVWGDEWIQFDSEWTTQPQIQKLWENIFTWVGPRNRCFLPKD